MSLLFRYSDPKGIDEPATLTALGSNVRWGKWAVSESADLGSPAMSTVDLDDDAAAFSFVGLRALEIRETSAPSNNQIVGRFVIQDRTVRRGPSSLTGATRMWSMDLVDYNWHLGKRVFTDSDANRPRETPGDRIRWLLHHAAHINLHDMGHVTYPSSPVLDANDYRGQRPTDLLADCCIEGQYNYWVDFNEALGRPELFFMDPDSADYASDVYISNDLDDVDQTVVFAPAEDTELRRSAARVAYGVYLAYQGGAVYVRNDTVGEQFAKIDQTAPMSNVKTAARARRVAQKFLNVNDTEDDRIRTSILVPRAQVNDIRHGHLLGVKFTHLPGYETWTATRVLNRAIAQEEVGGEDYYRLLLELVPCAATAPEPPVPPFTGQAFAALINHFDQDLPGGTGSENPALFASDGTLGVPAGWYAEPQVSSAMTINGSAGEWRTITANYPMTVRIEATLFFYEVTVADDCTVTMQILVNGAAIATETHNKVGSGVNVQFYLNVPSHDLAAGDVVSVRTAWDGIGYGWTGGPQNESFLRVGRGTTLMSGGLVEWIGPC
jgi:hypothetical protein